MWICQNFRGVFFPTLKLYFSYVLSSYDPIAIMARPESHSGRAKALY